MKKISLLILVLLAFLYSNAQNYAPLIKNKVSYYSDSINIYATYITDSNVFNNISSFNFNNSLQYQDNSLNCHYNIAPWWIGNKCKIYHDTLLQLFNNKMQPINISFNTGLNQSQLMFETDSIDFWIRQTHIEQADIFGEIDTLKHFTIEVTDKAKQPINTHTYSNATIALSKEHGFTQAINFYFFPDLPIEYFNILDRKICPKFSLAGYTNASSGVKNLTFESIFDFDTGDVFHEVKLKRSSGWSSPISIDDDSSWIQTTITGRINYTDSITYFLNKKTYTKMLRIRDKNFTSTDTLIHQEQKTTYIKNNYKLLNAEPIDLNTNFADCNLISDDGLPGKRINYFSIQYRDTCLNLIPDGNHQTFSYYKGIGGGYYEWLGYDPLFNPYDIFKLVYFKKRGAEWGVPFPETTGLLKTTDYNNLLSVFPNPFKDKIHISFNGLNPIYYKVKIFDIQGKIQLSTELNNNIEIDASELKPDIYFMFIENEFNERSKPIKIVKP
jgi:hypothetical protein